jgi:glyoxylase-like metal-dependent hydrolase (beta-lactamase superfamily II)
MNRKKFITETTKYGALSLLGSTLLKHNLFAKNSLPINHHLSSPKENNFMNIVTDISNISTVVKLKGKEVKIHAISTGTVAVKKKFRTKYGKGELAKVNIILDTQFTEYMPIWVWVIEHPEGLLVIDTGEVSAVKDINTHLAKESKFDRYFYRNNLKFNIEEGDELNHQFEKLSLKIDDVKLVVLTHLHLDHTDGFKFFPKQEIIVGNYEFDHTTHNCRSNYPSWFKPNKVNYVKNKIDVFNDAFPITRSEDLLFIPTPGHTLGHSSIIFKTDNFDILFAGDISFNQEQVLKGELAGINIDYKKAKQTYEKLLQYATNKKLIYLPSHDANAGQRLVNREFLV